MRLDRNTIKEMAGAGIGFYVNVPDPAGTQSEILRPHEIEEFVNDREQFLANRYSVSKEAYLKWLESGGIPQCGAFTKTGQRCRNPVSGGIQMALPRWVKLEGDYCTVHGGLSSEEAHHDNC